MYMYACIYVYNNTVYSTVRMKLSEVKLDTYTKDISYTQKRKSKFIVSCSTKI